jgi:DNA-binding response OmpR family regulator
MAKVLFIEDNLGWQDTMQRLLNTAGHEACRATSFDIAIALLGGKQRFDLIVFDLRLSEEDVNINSFVWLDALIQGMKARKLFVPPIVIVTGLDITKKDIVHIFTEYRDYVYGFFEKKDFNPKDFMQSLKTITNPSTLPSQTKGRPFISILGYTLLMTTIMLLTFSTLLRIVGQVQDPQVQQTILQVGGTVIVVIAIFVSVFSQNTKLENVIEWISKILRG